MTAAYAADAVRSPELPGPPVLFDPSVLFDPPSPGRK
jgi:hypothetical protein